MSRLAAAAVASLILCTAPDGRAATMLAKTQQNGSGACQGALPAFSGTLRARPLALQNEGAVTAFASCSPAYNDYEPNGEGASAVNLRLVNNGLAAVDVTCTLVDGSVSPSVDAVYLPAVVHVPAGMSASVSWGPTDYPAPQPDSVLRPNISCALPPGVGIGYVNLFYQRQIGQ